MSESTQHALYDAKSKNTFPTTLRRGSSSYDVVFTFGELTDDRYKQWIGDLRVRGNADEVDEEIHEANCKLFDDLILSIDGVEYEQGADWKALFPDDAKSEAIKLFLAVAIAEDADAADAKFSLAEQPKSQFVVTECWLHGEVAQQSHELKVITHEMRKQYEAIQSKRFRRPKIGGLSKMKTKVEFVPQDAKIGEFYDSLHISTDGFAGNVVPLRFKTVVIHHLFAPTVDARTVGK